MKIDVALRSETVGRCPFCLDAADTGPACPRCGARYHDECALIVGRCGVLACLGRLPTPDVRATGTPMPRLRALALRLWRGHAALGAVPGAFASAPAPFVGPRHEGTRTTASVTDAGVPPGALSAPKPGATWSGGREAIVVLLPARGASADAAALLGRLLGQTALDGRLRLSSPVPEPLLRVSDVDQATRVVDQMRAAGLDALAVPLGDIVRPLEHAIAGQVVRALRRGEDAVVRDEQGGALLLPPRGARLVVAVQLVQVTRRQERRAIAFEGSGRIRGSGGRPTTRVVEQKQYDPAALVFGREPSAPPVLVRLSRLATDPTVAFGGGEVGLAAATGVVRWARLLEQLCAGATHWTLGGSTNPTLLTPRTATVPGADDVQDNLPCVLLAARCMHRAWLAGRPPAGDRGQVTAANR